MHPLFHDQPLCCIQATLYKLAVNRNSAVQQPEAYSTFKAFKFGGKSGFLIKLKNSQTQICNQQKECNNIKHLTFLMLLVQPQCQNPNNS